MWLILVQVLICDYLASLNICISLSHLEINHLKCFLSLSNFLFHLFLLSLVLHLLPISQAKKGCPLSFGVPSKPRISFGKAREVSGRCQASTCNLQNSVYVDSAQIQTKFWFFKLAHLFSKFIPGEGRDYLALDLYPFRQILSLSIYFDLLKLNSLNVN